MFGKVLKEIRIKNGDSLPKLGEKIPVAFSYIDRVEKGKTSISKKIFEKILEIYKFDNEKLIEAYCEEMLPEVVKKKMIKTNENKRDILLEMFLLISKMDKKIKKNIILSIIERLEYISLKEGKYDKIKNILDQAKEKTENL